MSNKYILKSTLKLIEKSDSDNIKAEQVIWIQDKSINQSMSGSLSYLNNTILKKEFYKDYKNILNLLKENREFWSNVFYYDFNKFDKAEIVKKKQITSEKILAENFQNILSVLLNLNFQQKENFNNIIDLLKKLVPNFQDLIIQTTEERGISYLAFSEMDWNKNYAPISLASDGIIRLLCILCVLFNDIKPYCIILDEPENGIHPALRKILADFILATSDETQIFLLTHDSEMLSIFELNMIYYLKRKRNFTEIRQLRDDKSLEKLIKDLKDFDKITLIIAHKSDSI